MRNSTYPFSKPESVRMLAAVLAHITANPSASNPELATEFGISTSAMSRYVVRLHEDGKIHQVKRERRAAPRWVAGADPVSTEDQLLAYFNTTPRRERTDEEIEAADVVNMAPKRKIAAAQQVGMWRDSLVAALFGEAGAQVSA